MKHPPNKLWFILFTSMAFLFKDIVATLAIMSTEPGITAKTAMYYSIAQLPGRLLFNTTGAIVFNVIFGAFIGWILYGWAIRRFERAIKVCK